MLRGCPSPRRALPQYALGWGRKCRAWGSWRGSLSLSFPAGEVPRCCEDSWGCCSSGWDVHPVAWVGVTRLWCRCWSSHSDLEGLPWGSPARWGSLARTSSAPALSRRCLLLLVMGLMDAVSFALPSCRRARRCFPSTSGPSSAAPLSSSSSLLAVHQSCHLERFLAWEAPALGQVRPTRPAWVPVCVGPVTFFLPALEHLCTEARGDGVLCCSSAPCQAPGPGSPEFPQFLVNWKCLPGALSLTKPAYFIYINI